MGRVSFLYAAGGRLLVRSGRGSVREAEASEWREAAHALNRRLDDPLIARYVPGYVSPLLLPPGQR